MAMALRRDGFTYRVYSLDHEPPHVHVEKGGATLVLEIAPRIAIRDVRGMKANDVRRAVTIAQLERAVLLAKWMEVHGD